MNRRLLLILAVLAAAATAAAIVVVPRLSALPAASPQAVTAVPTAALALGTTALCQRYSGLPPGWGENPHAGMARIDAGQFELGSMRGYGDERPTVPTQVAGFWIDRTEVSNAQFEQFVKATGYVTDAERGGGVAVFRPPQAGEAVDGPGSWWQLVEDANWRHPEGKGSDIDGRGHEPVVAVSRADAQAYASWLGRRLPTEIEWEFAAKAGRDNETADRSLRDAEGRAAANFWQGLFPYDDRNEDGYVGRAPVGCFPATGNGLHDMVGNVWEWTDDLYSERHGTPAATAAVPRRVIKGGSFLCADNYCARARASSRQPQEQDLPTSHVGFRTVADL